MDEAGLSLEWLLRNQERTIKGRISGKRFKVLHPAKTGRTIPYVIGESMPDNLLTAAKRIAGKLADNEIERRRIAVESFAILEQEDPKTAKLALKVFVDRDKAADWLTDSIRSLGELTPWQCIADGKVEQVRLILNAIEYGVYV